MAGRGLLLFLLSILFLNPTSAVVVIDSDVTVSAGSYYNQTIQASESDVILVTIDTTVDIILEFMTWEEYNHTLYNETAHMDSRLVSRHGEYSANVETNGTYVSLINNTMGTKDITLSLTIEVLPQPTSPLTAIFIIGGVGLLIFIGYRSVGTIQEKALQMQAQNQPTLNFPEDPNANKPEEK